MSDAIPVQKNGGAQLAISQSVISARTMSEYNPVLESEIPIVTAYY